MDMHPSRLHGPNGFRAGGMEGFRLERHQELIYPFDIEYGSLETKSGFERPVPDGVVLQERAAKYFEENKVSFTSALAANRMLIGSVKDPEDAGELQKLNFLIDAVHAEVDETEGDAALPARTRQQMGDFLGNYVHAGRMGIGRLEHYTETVRNSAGAPIKGTNSVFAQYVREVEAHSTQNWVHWQDYFLNRVHSRSPHDVYPDFIANAVQTEAEVCFAKSDSPFALKEGLEIAKHIRYEDMNPLNRYVLEPSAEVGHIIREVHKLPSAKEALAVLDVITPPLFDRLAEVKKSVEDATMLTSMGRSAQFLANYFPLHVAETAFETVALKRYIREMVATGATLQEAIGAYADHKAWHLDLSEPDEYKNSELDTTVLGAIDVLTRVVEPLGESGKAESERLFKNLLLTEARKFWDTLDMNPKETQRLVAHAIDEVESGVVDGDFDALLENVTAGARAIDTLYAIKSHMVNEGLGLGEAKELALAEADSMQGVGLSGVIEGWKDGWYREVQNYTVRAEDLRTGVNDDRILPVHPDSFESKYEYNLLYIAYRYNSTADALAKLEKVGHKASLVLDEKMNEARAKGSNKQEGIDILNRALAGEIGYWEMNFLEGLGKHRGMVNDPMVDPGAPGIPINIAKVTEVRDDIVLEEYGDFALIQRGAERLQGYVENEPSVQHAVHAYLRDVHQMQLEEPVSLLEPIDDEAVAGSLKHCIVGVRSVLLSYFEDTNGENPTEEPEVDEPEELYAEPEVGTGPDPVTSGEHEVFAEPYITPGAPRVVAEVDYSTGQVSVYSDDNSFLGIEPHPSGGVTIPGLPIPVLPPTASPEGLATGSKLTKGRLIRRRPNPAKVDAKVLDDLARAARTDPAKVTRVTDRILRMQQAEREQGAHG